MFDKTSRYYKIDVATLQVLDSSGQPRTISYIRRRFIPSNTNQTSLVEHTVTQNERLDNITARYLGDPTQFWRVCDANTVLQPTALTAEIGHVIEIALPNV